LERTCLALLSKVADIEDTRRRLSSTLHEFYVAQGTAPAGEARDPWRNGGPPAAGPSRPQA
jgi:hypothetical protein